MAADEPLRPGAPPRPVAADEPRRPGAADEPRRPGPPSPPRPDGVLRTYYVKHHRGRPESARLFVALELPPGIRDTLSEWSQTQLADRPSLRRVRPESLHVTLCFLGQRPLTELEGIATACRTVASFPAPTLSLGEPLWLPPRRPRVLALNLVGELDALSLMQSTLAASLVARGFYEPETRPFLAHITAARVRSGHRQRPAEVPSPQQNPFTATTVTLFQSRLGQGPAHYQALESVQLTG